MANYFSYFPSTIHDAKQDGTLVAVTNILKRFIIKDSVANRVDRFQEYNIEDGDRPDVIADRFYGDSNYAWVILIYNRIIDPFYEWPLFGAEFTNYITNKYGSVSAAMATNKKYYRILYDGFVKIDRTRVPAKKLEIDLTTYNTLAGNEKSIQTAYEWEVEQNDERRNIRILDDLYVDRLSNELETILFPGA